jgi:hypothetical protein
MDAYNSALKEYRLVRFVAFLLSENDVFGPNHSAIGIRSTATLEIAVSKPNLKLIHCSTVSRPKAERGRHGEGFRPLVIQGGAPARCLPSDTSQEVAFQLIDVSLWVSYRSCLAIWQASLSFLNQTYGSANRA